MKFLGRVLATLVGLFIFVIILFFGMMIFGVAMSASSDKVVVKSNSVIELDLSEINSDYVGKFTDPWVTMIASEGKTGFVSVLSAIRKASEDDRIKGITIINNQSALGIGQLKELRDALVDFKKSGKFISSYADYYTQREYYLSSVADTIYVNPVGAIDFKGLSTEIMFFKDLQEKSGIKMEVLRHGQFKSAVEPFLDNKMSEANRLQTSTMLTSIWDVLASDISQSRKIELETLNTIANDLSARTPEMAKDQKLIDKIGYEDQFHDGIRSALGIEKEKEYNSVTIAEYAQNVGNSIKKGTSAKDKIAIIYAQGEIKSGEGAVSYIGEGAMRKSLQDARNDKNIKAIVLRIDSPGGSALTSELIWREIELTKKVKPVVVSMGNVAASGGYYIACNANKIIAEPTTITGSIGVFGMLVNFTDFTKKIGINTEQVATHKNAAEYSPFKPIDPNFRAVTQESIEKVYDVFISRVADGRKMTKEAVDAIGQGRIWSGIDAKKIGLVDEIGGINEAINEAAKIAKISEYKTVSYPEFDTKFSEMFAKGAFAKMYSSNLEEELGAENYKVLKTINEWNKQQGVMMLMPYTLSIK